MKNKKSQKNLIIIIIFLYILYSMFSFGLQFLENTHILNTYKKEMVKVIEINDYKSVKNQYTKGSKRYIDLTLKTKNNEIIILDDYQIEFSEKRINEKIKENEKIVIYKKGNDVQLGFNVEEKFITSIFSMIIMFLFLNAIIIIFIKNNIKNKNSRKKEKNV